MAGWLDGIGSKLGSLVGKRPAAAFFGAFGKHPGWDDHLDDIGLDSEPLLAAKQYLYVQGIGGVIDTGQWEALPADDVLAEFRHVFVWCDERETLVGKLWSSSDGKGRKKYPMVVCAHFSNRVAEGVPDMSALLDSVESACRATASPDEVRRIIGEARAAAAEMVESPERTSVVRADFLNTVGLTPDSETAARIPYAVGNDFAALESSGVGRVRINLKLGQFKGAPQHVRLPADPSRPLGSQRFWQDFLAELIPAGAPQLYIAPASAPWMDVIVGLPTPRHLFCLRAGAKAMPLANTIPFNFSDEARRSGAERWKKFLAVS